MGLDVCGIYMGIYNLFVKYCCYVYGQYAGWNAGPWLQSADHHVDGLVEERRNSSALAMELCLFFH